LPPCFAGLISHLAYYVENYYAKRVCLIIAATPSIARRFEGLNHIIVINNYPLFKEMFFTKNEIIKKRQVCYIGSISEIRCINEIVEAAYLSKEKIVICGEFESEQLFDSVINKRGWEYIEYQGYLPVEDMINRMQNSMAGLLLFAPKANHIEAVPSKLFEYMASGIPVIASDFPNWHKIMSEYDCGVCVNPKNPKEIAMAIKMLLDDPKAASSMGKRGACAVQEKYNWESEAKLLIEGYRNLNWGMENV
jgi:glycosyltransferase involved in cell wall biosynthesis